MGGKKPLRLVTKMEDRHYADMKTRLEKGDGAPVEIKDINRLLAHVLTNRKRFEGYLPTTDIIMDLVESQLGIFKPLLKFIRIFCKCKFQCRKRIVKDSEEYKIEKRYVNGVERYFNEMNIIKILK